MRMKYWSLGDSEDRLWKGRSEKFAQLFRDPRFRARRTFLLGKNIEGKLARENFVSNGLEIQEIYRLLLKFINSSVSSLGCWLKNSHCRGLHHKFVMQTGQK